MDYLNISDYEFEKSDFKHYFKTLYRDRGMKAFYQFLNRPHRRAISRSLIERNSPKGIGLEIGCGARTISPTNRTVLSDAFSDHGVHGSIAKVFFEGADIPYENESFSFVLNEHVLEHIANPIKAIQEWTRVLKKGGHLYLVLPHKERTNDKHREVTTLEHLIADYEKNVPYNDPEHFDDWFSNVVERGLMPEHYKHMQKEQLLDTASIHHHVWTEREVEELLKYLDLEIIFVDSQLKDRRDSFVIIAKKEGELPQGLHPGA